MNTVNKSDTKMENQDKDNLKDTIPVSILEIIKHEEKEQIHALQQSSINRHNVYHTNDEQEGHKTYSQLEKEVEEGKKIKIGECV